MRAEARLAAREARSYEAPHAGSLWHRDFHIGSRRVLTARAQWATPVLLGVLDDHSRLALPLSCKCRWTFFLAFLYREEWNDNARSNAR